MKMMSPPFLRFRSEAGCDVRGRPAARWRLGFFDHGDIFCLPSALVRFANFHLTVRVLKHETCTLRAKGGLDPGIYISFVL
jgi:hypothetical protein